MEIIGISGKLIYDFLVEKEEKLILINLAKSYFAINSVMLPGEHKLEELRAGCNRYMDKQKQKRHVAIYIHYHEKVLLNWTSSNSTDKPV